MNRAYDTSRKRPLKTQYLILYNFISAILWLAVFSRVVILLPIVGHKNVYGGVGEFAKWTQTVALLEVLHSASGIVRSPLVTTLIQVSSRLLLVWGVVDNYPTATSPSPFYSSMLLAWSTTEIIRYTYFMLNLVGSVPGLLTWLRYNTFYVLYPVGITSEMLLIFNASNTVVADNAWQQWVFRGILLGYIPGSYVLYTHMITQRRKNMRGKQPERRT